MAAAVLVTASPAWGNTDDRGFGERHGCSHSHRSSVAYKRLRALLRHTRPSVDKQKVNHWAMCLATRGKAHRAHELARRWWKWRHRYGQVWTIRLNRVDAGTLSRLANLRGCETRGIPYPSNYKWDGHHDGAYQYLSSTWSRAQSYYSAVSGQKVVGWTSVAYAASPAHQDVVTAYFFPAHSGEWACTA